MKKTKVIKLTENQLVDIIRRVLNEGDPIPEVQKETRDPKDIRKEIEGIKGAEIIMSNASGVNKYKDKNQLLKTRETYKIKDVWTPEYKGLITVAFTVEPSSGGKAVQGNPGLFKGAFTKDSKHSSQPIQFRWDCNSYFEKGLGGINQQLQRYGGIKENYINVDLAKEIAKRPFCGKKAAQIQYGPITKKSFAGSPYN